MSDDVPIILLLLGIAGLVLLSAYFSSSETAMMALNRYRLAHLVKQRHRGARKVNRLVRRPDRLLGVILLGNNFVNNLAAALATVVGIRLLGESGVAIAPLILTMVFLIFAEIAPKTLAAHYPERIAFPSAFVLEPLLRLMYPIVWALNGLSNFVLKPFKIDSQYAGFDPLSADELRTLLIEASGIPERRRNMLLGILDLEHVSVAEIMVPRSAIAGLDLDDDIDDLMDQIKISQYSRLPVYHGNMNNPVGVLDLMHAPRFLAADPVTKAALLQETKEPYFIPESTPLHTQLFNFQEEERSVALVVDEYGDVQGMLTREDIIGEIVGKLSAASTDSLTEIQPQPDETYIAEGSTLLREINRELDWNLPIGGPRTLNGLILEHLEFIPEANVCLQIGNYRMETLAIKDNTVRSVRLLATLTVPDEEGSEEEAAD